MKNPLRSIFVAVALLCAAMTANAQFRYGPLIGGNVTNFHFKQDLVDVTKQFGGHAGLQAEMMFPGIGIGIDFGMLYYMNGANVNLGQRPVWAGCPELGIAGFGNEKTLIHNLQIPIHLRFKWTRMNGFEEILAPFVYGGPDFNIQLGHSPVEAGDRKAFAFSGGDLGLTVGGGLELFRHYQVSFGYTWGMTYVLKTRLLKDFSARCSGWQFRVAYLF
ncbi:MAG: porin family protein [Muribaculaceae bacterium]|nr:porin family protein [Muribaculaceae bacterium]MDE6119924.1 porin family protein [Muribaculaceae bacterium]